MKPVIIDRLYLLKSLLQYNKTTILYTMNNYIHYICHVTNNIFI